MRKKRRFLGLLLMLLLLGGLAVGLALMLAPDRAGEAWQSLAARFRSLAARPVEPSPKPLPDAVAGPGQNGSPAKPAIPLTEKASSKGPLATVGQGPATSKGPSTTVPARPLPNTSLPSKQASATTELARAFESSTDEGGGLLAQRLAPPRQMPLAPTPFVREPRPRAADQPEELMPRTARLPAPAPAAAPLVVGAERRTAQRGQPALDRPPLAAELDPARPQRPNWPAAAMAYAASANADMVPALRFVGLPVADTATPQDDPTADSSRKAMLTGTSIPSPVPPPFLRLTIPDPFEVARIVQLPDPPPERDPPEPSFQRPRPPPLPAPEAPKKK